MSKIVAEDSNVEMYWKYKGKILFDKLCVCVCVDGWWIP